MASTDDRGNNPPAAAALALIGAPSSAGARNLGQEGAPAALAAAGLAAALRTGGLRVMDQGNLPRVGFAPDALAPRGQNLPLVVAVANMVAQRVRAAHERGALPLVIGGDCTVTLGAVAGAGLPAAPLGLIYMDGDLDLNVPADSPSGIFDGMVLAHLLGHGEDQLCRIGSAFPLVREAEAVVFGYNAGSGYIDAGEQRKLAASSLHRFPVSSVRGRPQAAACEALACLPSHLARVLVHFDVDVIDGDEFAAADLPHRGGLALGEAMEALRVFVQTPRFAGLVVTEFNPARDPDLVFARRLVAGLADSFRGAPWA